MPMQQTLRGGDGRGTGRDSDEVCACGQGLRVEFLKEGARCKERDGLWTEAEFKAARLRVRRTVNTIVTCTVTLKQKPRERVTRILR